MSPIARLQQFHRGPWYVVPFVVTFLVVVLLGWWSVLYVMVVGDLLIFGGPGALDVLEDRLITRREKREARS